MTDADQIVALDQLTAIETANDNQPDPEVLARRASLATASAPSEDYLRIRSRLERRQRVGGDGPVAANDNQGWPLAEQLRRDGNEVLLHVAERYRTVYDAAKFEPRLVGTVPDEFWSPEQNHAINRETGKLKVNGQKRSKTAAATPSDDGTFKAVAVTDEAWAEMVENGPVTFSRRPVSPTMRKWTGDNALIAAIDARPMLRRLQAALGPLLDPFEDAVIGSLTLTEIGRAGGVGQHAAGAGKFAVMLGLEAVQREFHQIDREAAA